MVLSSLDTGIKTKSMIHSVLLVINYSLIYKGSSDDEEGWIDSTDDSEGVESRVEVERWPSTASGGEAGWMMVKTQGSGCRYQGRRPSRK